jgi:hypothetical protein
MKEVRSDTTQLIHSILYHLFLLACYSVVCDFHYTDRRQRSSCVVLTAQAAPTERGTPCRAPLLALLRHQPYGAVLHRSIILDN